MYNTLTGTRIAVSHEIINITIASHADVLVSQVSHCQAKMMRPLTDEGFAMSSRNGTTISEIGLQRLRAGFLLPPRPSRLPLIPNRQIHSLGTTLPQQVRVVLLPSRDYTDSSSKLFVTPKPNSCFRSSSLRGSKERQVKYRLQVSEAELFPASLCVVFTRTPAHARCLAMENNSEFVRSSATLSSTCLQRWHY